MNNAGGDGLFPTRWSLPVDKFALNFGTVLRVLKRNVRHALIGFPQASTSPSFRTEPSAWNMTMAGLRDADLALCLARLGSLLAATLLNCLPHQRR